MTNRRRFFYNGILLTAVGLAIRVVAMLFNSYITKTIGAEGIGLFTLIGTVYSFAITFATSGINLTVTRLVASEMGKEGQGCAKRILRSSVLYALVFSAAATTVLFCLAKYFGVRTLGDERTVIPLRILAISLIPIALSAVFSGYFVGVRRVARNAIVQVLAQVFKIGITLLLLSKVAPYGASYAVIALCFCSTACEVLTFLALFVQYLFDRKRLSGAAGGGALASVVSMAIPLALSAYIRSALLTLEHILIPKRLKDRGESHSDALADYGILHGMALPLLILPMAPLSSFAGLLVPEFAESTTLGRQKRMQRIANEALNTTLVYASFVAVVLALFSEELGYSLYNSFSAGKFIAVMAPVVPIMYLDHVTDSMLKGLGEHVYSMWVNIIDSILSVILVWVLIPLFGIAGYAIVIIIMEGFNFILSAIRLKKRIKFRIFALRSILLPLASAGAASMICRALFTMNGADSRLIYTVMKIVFVISVFLAIYLPISKIIGKNKSTELIS